MSLPGLKINLSQICWGACSFILDLFTFCISQTATVSQTLLESALYHITVVLQHCLHGKRVVSGINVCSQLFWLLAVFFTRK